MKKLILAVVCLAFLNACATDPYTGESKVSKTAWGTGIGTALGAGVGALVGGEKGALIGAGIGAAGGAATGGYMDLQAKKLRQELLGTGVQVVQSGGTVRLIMPGNITFNTNESTIRPNFNKVLDSVAKVINEYDKTKVQILGYTDNTGSDSINNPLSLARAQSISNYLVLRGVNAGRINAYGLGSKNPIASNGTPEGREQNRRVELSLVQQ